MKRSEAANYARWCAAAALVLASLTVGVYLQRKWVAHREKEKAPPPAPRDVTRLSSGLTFSKVEGNRTIFTVEASKATDFKDKDASLLEDVKITIFGNAGARHDTIHTQSCQYEKQGGSIHCSGEVQMDLQSAEEAERVVKNPAAPGQKMHVETRGVTFNRASGTVQTDQPVQFTFPNGSGQAIGVEYKSEEGSVRLLHDVQFTLRPPASPSSAKIPDASSIRGEVYVMGTSLDFDRTVREMVLHGPTLAQTQTVRLTSPVMLLDLDSTFRVKVFRAEKGRNGGRPDLQLQTGSGPTQLAADSLMARFAPQGWVTKVEATGNVRGSRQTEDERQSFSSAAASLDLWPRVSQPKELNLNSEVVLSTQSTKSMESQVLQTNALRLNFSGGMKGQPNRPVSAETLAPGTLEWTDVAPAGTAAARTKLQADKLDTQFGRLGKVEQLNANGNVRAERMLPGSPSQTATAKSGTAKILATGGWSQMDLQGEARLKEGDRSGQAEHAVFVRATQTAVLTGKALARDATTETQASRITFTQTTGDIRAEGGVRSTDFSAKGSAVQLAAVPANISADVMQANSKTGKALYSGHARLWEGNAVLEANSIELLREARVLTAAGNVRAVFPQTPGQTPAQAMTMQSTTIKPKLWHVTAGTLTYREAENRAHLEKNVVAQSVEQTMRGAAVDLYFTGAGAASAHAAISATGTQQISRAVGTGGVIVEQGTRKATAERGEYTAADGKFVMTGGNPTIYDASEGTTTGRQLTFFLADDTIIVDSENGLRTLTKHRVEK